MATEQTVFLVGCQESAQNMLISALNKVGIHAVPASYQDKFSAEKAPDCLLIYLNESDISSAHLLLNQNGLEATKKLLIIDPRIKPCRQFSATANIDDVIFKPVRLKELISRIQLLLSREIIKPDGKSTICDEIDFAQRLQEFADTSFTGIFLLNGHDLEAEIIFQKGVVKGIKTGLKIQKNAADAIWRIFPASHATKPVGNLPVWCERNPLKLSISEIIDHVTQASTCFHDKLSEKYSLQTVFKMNSSAYDKAFDSLPRQVRQIIQTFDGAKTLREVFDSLNLSEYLIMQIILRLLDENLIVECEPASENVSLSDWIHADSSLNEVDLNSLNELGAEDLCSGEEATPSAIFYVDQMRPVIQGQTAELSLKKEESVELAELKDKPKAASSSDESVNDELQTYDRASIILHLATAHEPFSTAENVIKKDTYYDENILDDEVGNDSEKHLEAGDVLKVESSFFYDWPGLSYGNFGNIELNEELDLTDIKNSPEKSSDSGAKSVKVSEKTKAESVKASKEDAEEESDEEYEDTEAESDEEYEDDEEESDEEYEDDDEYSDDDSDMEGDWFDDEPHDSLHADSSFSPVKLYKQNHAAELSPEEWKRNTLARLEKERKQKDARIMRILVAAIAVALIILIVLIISRRSGSPEETAVHSPEKVAQNVEKPEFPSPEPEDVTEGELAAQGSVEIVEEQAGDVEVIKFPAVAENSAAAAVVPEPAPVVAPAPVIAPAPVVAPEPEPFVAPVQAARPVAVKPAPVQVVNSAPAPVVESQASSKKERSIRTEPSLPSAASDSVKKAESRPVEVNEAPAKAPEKIVAAAPAVNSGNLNAQLQPVRDAINKKDMDSAWNLLQPILKNNPNNPMVLNMAVQIATRQGNNEKALEYLKKLEPTNGSKPAYWKQRAKLHKALGQMDEALEAEGKAEPVSVKW